MKTKDTEAVKAGEAAEATETIETVAQENVAQDEEPKNEAAEAAPEKTEETQESKGILKQLSDLIQGTKIKEVKKENEDLQEQLKKAQDDLKEHETVAKSAIDTIEALKKANEEISSKLGLAIKTNKSLNGDLNLDTEKTEVETKHKENLNENDPRYKKQVLSKVLAEFQPSSKQAV